MVMAAAFSRNTWGMFLHLSGHYQTNQLHTPAGGSIQCLWGLSL
jgi:hypothetical protein